MLMRAEDKAKWVAALRSGKYSQCDGELKKGNAYCCLGVMEQVLSGEVESQALPSPQWCSDHNVAFDNQDEWMEYGSYVDAVDDDTMALLAEMNDGKKKFVTSTEWTWEQEPKSFTEIADWIEVNVVTID